MSVFAWLFAWQTRGLIYIGPWSSFRAAFFTPSMKTKYAKWEKKSSSKTMTDKNYKGNGGNPVRKTLGELYPFEHTDGTSVDNKRIDGLWKNGDNKGDNSTTLLGPDTLNLPIIIPLDDKGGSKGKGNDYVMENYGIEGILKPSKTTTKFKILDTSGKVSFLDLRVGSCLTSCLSLSFNLFILCFV